ncbi:MAG: RNase H family protein [Bacteriovoracia bacterium]
MKLKRILAYTDGSALGNPGPGGWGVLCVLPTGEVIERGGSERITTNNRMELKAAIETLIAVAEVPGPVEILTDSKYLIEGSTRWIFSWRRRGWKTMEGQPVANRELWEQLGELIAGRTAGLTWTHVDAHRGVPGNERVDQIAQGFAADNHVDLYAGPLENYSITLDDLLNTDPRLLKKTTGGSKNKGPGFSYLSLVDGKVMRHATWPECEARVKGRSGAKYKKAMSPADEQEILKAWGVSLA